jgi:hypothetical protein
VVQNHAGVGVDITKKNFAILSQSLIEKNDGWRPELRLLKGL